MDNFKLYAESQISSLINPRAGEQKIGQCIQFCSLDKLSQSDAKYVLLGIPEDIGVRANYGIGGAKGTWNAMLKSFLNIQSNTFLTGKEMILLGHFYISEPENNEIEHLRTKVRQIDSLIFPVIQIIIDAGKTPIVVGGGHNNAFPIIHGASMSLKQKLNVVNIDAHADLRDLKEGRHSGNGFNYAIQNGFLNEYRVFGLHQNYINQGMINFMDAHPQIKAAYFENLLKSDQSMLRLWCEFTEDLPEPCGLEIDMDSIENMLSSAVSPSGFRLNEIRQILMQNHKKYRYLHICEGAPKLNDGRENATIGKTIAYLISDFVKAQMLINP